MKTFTEMEQMSISDLENYIEILEDNRYHAVTIKRYKKAKLLAGEIEKVEKEKFV